MFRQSENIILVKYHLNRTEVAFMLLVAPVCFPRWQVNCLLLKGSIMWLNCQTWKLLDCCTFLLFGTIWRPTPSANSVLILSMGSPSHLYLVSHNLVKPAWENLIKATCNSCTERQNWDSPFLCPLTNHWACLLRTGLTVGFNRMRSEVRVTRKDKLQQQVKFSWRNWNC